MAWADIIQTVSQDTGGSFPSSMGVSISSAVEENLLVCGHFTGNGNSITPSGFSEAVAVTDAGNADQAAIYYKIASGGETSVVVEAGGADEHMAHILEVEGPWDESPLDETSSAGPQTDSSCECGTTGTTSQADEFAVAIGTTRDEDRTFESWSNDFTEEAETATAFKNFGIATKILSATGTVSTVATLSNFSQHMGAIATFKMASSGIIQAVGPIVETNSLQPITHFKAQTLSQIGETVSPLAVAATKLLALGQPLEADGEQPVDLEPFRRLLDTLVETDTLGALTGAKERALAQAAETVGALGLTVEKAKTLGIITEADEALELTATGTILIGLVSEANFVPSLAAEKTQGIALVTETNEVQAVSTESALQIDEMLETAALHALGAAQAKTIETLAELVAARSLQPEKMRQIAQVLEAGTLQAISVVQGTAVGLLTETEAVLALSALKETIIDQMFETDAVFGITAAGEVVGMVLRFVDALVDAVRTHGAMVDAERRDGVRVDRVDNA